MELYSYTGCSAQGMPNFRTSLSVKIPRTVVLDYKQLHLYEHFNILRYCAILNDCSEGRASADHIRGKDKTVTRATNYFSEAQNCACRRVEVSSNRSA
jgi:hypothetical protein